MLVQVRLAYEEPHQQGPHTIAWEIQNVERLLERLEKRETLKELVKQQRDTIYINIATNASRRERYQLYNRWGIRKLSTGRLRKLIYELLWKHPKRYVCTLYWQCCLYLVCQFKCPSPDVFTCQIATLLHLLSTSSSDDAEKDYAQFLSQLQFGSLISEHHSHESQFWI